MLCTFDIGNTSISIGLFDGDTIRNTWRMGTDPHKSPDEYAVFLLNLLQYANVQRTDVTEIMLSSVVPALVSPFIDISKRYFGKEPLLLAPGIRTGVRVMTDNPREVGADRIANAAAAHHYYGGPLMVIDFGTGTNFDVVSKDGDFIGGAIAPGIEIARDALFARAAKLPSVELVFPPSAIGKNTITAMQSGLLYGYVGLIEGISKRITAELGGSAKVIATGGLSTLIAPHAPFIETVDPFLTLKGLKIIHSLNR